MDELDPTSRALIDKALPSAWPQPDVEGRVLGQLRSRLATPEPSGEGDGGGDSQGDGPNIDTSPSPDIAEASVQPVNAPALATAGGMSKLALSLTLALVATAIVAGVASMGEPEPPPAQHQWAVEATPPAANPPPHSDPEEQPTSREIPLEAPDQATPKPARAPKYPHTLREPEATPSTPVTKPASTDTLADETALIVAANAALAREDAPTVLEFVERHEREYPEGLLKSEREALRSMAMCTLGHPGAQATYTAFTREHPNSTHLKRVRTLCRDLKK